MTKKPTEDPTDAPAAATILETGLLLLPDDGDSPILVQERNDYRRRLKTFASPVTYFAKPLSLSPMVVAAFGWENVDTDLLVCACCKAAWAVGSTNKLPADAQRSLLEKMQPKLSTAHFHHCKFRFEARQYLEQGSSNDNGKKRTHDELQQKRPTTKSIVPTSLARAMPPDVLHLVELEYPQTLFVKQYEHLLKQLLEGVSVSTNDSMQILLETLGEGGKKTRVPLEAPKQVCNFMPPVSSEESSEQSPKNLLDRIWLALQRTTAADTNENGNVPANTRNVVLTLALLGWKVLSDTDQQDETTATESEASTSEKKVSFECPLCLATLNVCVAAGSEQAPSDSVSPTKRTCFSPPPPNSILLKQHRYYCPYISGFVLPCRDGPPPIPLWQHLACKLCSDETKKDVMPLEESDVWIHKVLRSAVSPHVKSIKLSR